MIPSPKRDKKIVGPATVLPITPKIHTQPQDHSVAPHGTTRFHRIGDYHEKKFCNNVGVLGRLECLNTTYENRA